MFFVNDNHPYTIELTEGYDGKLPNRFNTKQKAIQYRFEKMLERMNNYNIQNVYSIYKKGKLSKVYTREFLEMSLTERMEKYPEIFI